MKEPKKPLPDAAMQRVVDQARRVRRAFRNGLPDLSALMLELVVAVECLDEPLIPGGEP